MVLLFLESIGTTELLVILVVALVVFGPRRLPELGRKIARGMGEFRRASDDFKRTWEREVALESTTERDGRVERAPLPAAEAAGPLALDSPHSIARGPLQPSEAAAAADAATRPEDGGTAAAESAPRGEQPGGKSDWL